jgi:hypothetical protein
MTIMTIVHRLDKDQIESNPPSVAKHSHSVDGKVGALIGGIIGAAVGTAVGFLFTATPLVGVAGFIVGAAVGAVIGSTIEKIIRATIRIISGAIHHDSSIKEIEAEKKQGQDIDDKHEEIDNLEEVNLTADEVKNIVKNNQQNYQVISHGSKDIQEVMVKQIGGIPLEDANQPYPVFANGSYPSFITYSSKGKISFIKEPKNEEIKNIEKGASQIASYFTDGLVPKGEIKKSLQSYLKFPFIDFKEGPFKSKDINFNEFTDQQLTQLFMHMVSDWVIMNYDAHNGQFGLDSTGNVIGYDKGQAFKFIKQGQFKYQNKFDPRVQWPPFDTNKSVYPQFCKFLNKNSEKLSMIINSVELNQTFDRITNTTEEQFTDYFGKADSYPYFQARATNVRRDFMTYFKIEMDPITV